MDTGEDAQGTPRTKVPLIFICKDQRAFEFSESRIFWRDAAVDKKALTFTTSVSVLDKDKFVSYVTFRHKLTAKIWGVVPTMGMGGTEDPTDDDDDDAVGKITGQEGPRRSGRNKVLEVLPERVDDD